MIYFLDSINYTIIRISVCIYQDLIIIINNNYPVLKFFADTNVT